MEPQTIQQPQTIEQPQTIVEPQSMEPQAIVPASQLVARGRQPAEHKLGEHEDGEYKLWVREPTKLRGEQGMP